MALKLLGKFKNSRTNLDVEFSALQLRRRSSVILIIAMVTASVILLILPELIYMKDIYPGHPRANTMFKLTFQAFLMMTLVISWLGGFISCKGLLYKLTPSGQLLGKLVFWLFVLATGYYSFFGYRDFYGGLENYQGIDGLSWLQSLEPGDYQGVVWLRENVDQRPVVLEAVGESYTTFARVSTFTGLPTVLGWRVHEWLWRGGFEIPAERTDHVRTMYEQPNSKEARNLFEQYGIQFVFLGAKEREAYKELDVQGLKQLGKEVFVAEEASIINLR